MKHEFSVFFMSEENKKINTDRRRFIKYGVAGLIGAGVASAVEIPILNNMIQNDNSQITQLQNQITTLKSQLGTESQMQGFLTLNQNDRDLIEAVAETMIPSDSSGPGAKEAGVVYFIDRMLAGSYGKGGNMFLQGPFVTPQKGSITVQGAVYPSTQKTPMTYSEGTITPRLQAGTAYQYPFNPREFWRRGLTFLQEYSNSAYGQNFEKLNSSQQTQILQDLFDNKPTNFQGPTPSEFFNELHDMVTAGYWTDPLYGGNIGMVGWQLLAFNANYWGDDIGLGSLKLMVADTPTRLSPKSLSTLQKEGGGA